MRKECRLRSPSRHTSPDLKFLDQSAFGKLLYEYVEHADRNNVPFNLTYEQVYELTKGTCYYCGVPPTQERRSNRGRTIYLFNGIDRLDNSKGYTTENSVSCCSRCNYGKKAMSEDEFVGWVKAVYEHMRLQHDSV